jgi:hypothetical protein
MASWRCCHDGRAAHHFAERAKSVEAANRTRIITFALSHRSSGHHHHKVGFAMKRPRLAVSNISDCSDVVSVYDYQNASDIELVKTFSAADLGYDGSTPLKTCDETGKVGLMLSPHGTGTSAARHAALGTSG